MIILKTVTTLQTLSFIARSATFNKMYLTNETNNTRVEVFIDLIVTDTYFHSIISKEFRLIDNTFYKLEIIYENGGINNLVFLGKIFCTDQVIADFTTNETTYTPNTAANEFIVL